MMRAARALSVIDYHTEGEPMRIVTDGVDRIPGAIIGTVFTGRIVGLTEVAGTPAVVPEITGRAWMMARGTLLLDRTDPFPGGFLL